MPERRIGDVEPLPPGWRREWWRHQRRVQVQRAHPALVAPVRALMERDAAEQAAAQARAACPIEQAKLTLRRRGVVVFAAAVRKPGATGWIVGTQHMTDAELIARAAKQERSRA
jgi:hypothetical protein